MSNDLVSNLNESKQKINLNSQNLSNKILDLNKKKQIIEIIKDSSYLYKRILKFEKIDISELKNVLFAKKLIVELDLLKEFLSQQGVMY